MSRNMSQNMNPKNEDTIRAFVDAWPALDIDRVVSFFAPDGIYHNIMLDPVQGQDNLRAFITAFLTGWSDVKWDILNMTSSGDLVFAERVDHFKVNGKPVSLPCCGVFEMKDGKIAAWRDYFDMGTYVKAVS